MVNSCVVWGCTNRVGVGDPGRRFYEIPRTIKHQGVQTEQLSTERRTLWLARINRDNFNPDPDKRYYKVCSDHFITGNKADLYDRTNPDWAPSLKLGPETESSAVQPVSAKKRYERVKERQNKRRKYHAAEALLSLQDENNFDYDAEDCVPKTKVSKPCNFVIKGVFEPLTEPVENEYSIAMGSRIREELQRLTTENIELKQKVNCTKSMFSPESLRNDEEKVKHYTGLTFDVLMALFMYLEPVINQTSKSAPSKFEKVMLVLMKIRLNLSLQDIGYRFNVSTSCVSKTFLDVVHIMYNMLKPLILWPERERI